MSRPGATVADAHRQGPQVGATSCRRWRHLTTAGRGWSFMGPAHKGKRARPSPDGGRGSTTISYERASGREPTPTAQASASSPNSIVSLAWPKHRCDRCAPRNPAPRSATAAALHPDAAEVRACPAGLNVFPLQRFAFFRWAPHSPSGRRLVARSAGVCGCATGASQARVGTTSPYFTVSMNCRNRSALPSRISQTWTTGTFSAFPVAFPVPV